MDFSEDLSAMLFTKDSKEYNHFLNGTPGHTGIKDTLKADCPISLNGLYAVAKNIPVTLVKDYAESLAVSVVVCVFISFLIFVGILQWYNITDTTTTIFLTLGYLVFLYLCYSYITNLNILDGITNLVDTPAKYHKLMIDLNDLMTKVRNQMKNPSVKC